MINKTQDFESGGGRKRKWSSGLKASSSLNFKSLSPLRVKKEKKGGVAREGGGDGGLIGSSGSGKYILGLEPGVTNLLRKFKGLSLKDLKKKLEEVSASQHDIDDEEEEMNCS